MSQRPNILFILTDQMRSTAMGCAGVEVVRTPHLDRLASEGTRFINAVANTPACTPSRASLLTGKHVLTHGLVQNDMTLGFDHRAIGQCFTGAGYRSAYIGKWHVDGVNRGGYIPPGPRRQGFADFWAGTECNHDYFNGYYYDDATRQPIWFDGYEPDGQTNLAINYLEKQARNRDPFCLFLSWSPPHCPYEAVPDSYRRLYPPAEIALLPNATGSGIQNPGGLSDTAQQLRKRQIISGYYAHISAIDACVGRLMAALDAGDLRRNTIVVFTSDHGDMLFSHNRGWKCKPWRESVGIPLIMRWPGIIPAGHVTRGPISVVDLMPTLLRLAGVVIPGDVEGKNLAAFVRGDETAAQESVYINFPCMNKTWNMPGWRGVVTRTHTYAATPEGPWLLYDDIADPFQMANLAESTESRPLLKQLDGLTRRWLAETRDDFAPPAVIAERFIPNRNPWHFVTPPPLEPVIAERQATPYVTMGNGTAR